MKTVRLKAILGTKTRTDMDNMADDPFRFDFTLTMQDDFSVIGYMDARRVFHRSRKSFLAALRAAHISCRWQVIEAADRLIPTCYLDDPMITLVTDEGEMELESGENSRYPWLLHPNIRIDDIRPEILGREIVDRGEIIRVGNGIPATMNAPHYWPVQFEDRTFGILVDPKCSRLLTWYGDDEADELNEAIRLSIQMPVVSTLGTGIMRIEVKRDDCATGIIRVHYGFGKEDRIDFLKWHPL